MLAQVGCHVLVVCESSLSVFGVTGSITNLIVPKLIVAAEPDMLLSSIIDVGIAGVFKISLTHHIAWSSEVHLIARLKVISARVTLFLTIGQVDGGVREVLLHPLTLLW